MIKDPLNEISKTLNSIASKVETKTPNHYIIKIGEIPAHYEEDIEEIEEDTEVVYLEINGSYRFSTGTSLPDEIVFDNDIVNKLKIWVEDIFKKDGEIYRERMELLKQFQDVLKDIEKRP